MEGSSISNALEVFGSINTNHQNLIFILSISALLLDPPAVRIKKSRSFELEKKPAVMINKDQTFESKYKLLEELGK